MAIRIDEDGTMHMVASWKGKPIEVASRTEISSEGVVMHAITDHPLPWRDDIKTTVTLTPADLVTIIKWQLEHADGAVRRRFLQALLDISDAEMSGWIEYFLAKLAAD